MQKNIRVCCYTGRQIDLRFSRPNAGKARLTFQERVWFKVRSSLTRRFGVRGAVAAAPRLGWAQMDFPPSSRPSPMADACAQLLGPHLFFLESTFIDQINPKRQTAGPPEGGSPELDLASFGLSLLRLSPTLRPSHF